MQHMHLVTNLVLHYLFNCFLNFNKCHFQLNSHKWIFLDHLHLYLKLAQELTTISGGTILRTKAKARGFSLDLSLSIHNHNSMEKINFNNSLNLVFNLQDNKCHPLNLINLFRHVKFVTIKGILLLIVFKMVVKYAIVLVI